MSTKRFRKTLYEKIEAVEALPLLLDQLRSIRDQPPLPPDHPDAAAQKGAKSRARAALDHIEAQISEHMPLVLKTLREMVNKPSPLPPDHPHAAMIQEEKRKAQILLLLWNAHYGPGGPFEGLGPVQDDDGR